MTPLVLFIFTIFFLITPRITFAKNNFATIVNPIRLSNYTNNEHESVDTQYGVISKLNLPATWLLNYESMESEEIVDRVKKFNNAQELGIFLEITKNLCEESGVTYNDKFSWYHSANVFLTGYKQSDRIKLIDRVFGKYKEVFGNYPKSVGAWWVDSYSLRYLSEKYGVTANLGLADQFSTDGYQVWGTYWSTPYYPSELHAGQPSQNAENKINLVTTQWAPRDPWNGYLDSYYSTQDYLQTKEKLDTSFFEKLVRLYADAKNNPFGHITVGLESDLSKEAYTGEFANQMNTLSRLRESGDLEILNMANFADWYKGMFQDYSPAHFIKSGSLINDSEEIYWYNSPGYRLGLKYDKVSKKLIIFDWRVYQSNFAEPYYHSPNVDFQLRITIPSVIDKVAKNNEWEIDLGELRLGTNDDKKHNLKFVGGEIVFEEDSFLISSTVLEVPGFLRRNPYLIYSKRGSTHSFKPKTAFRVGFSGIRVNTLRKDLLPFIKYSLKSEGMHLHKWAPNAVERNYVSQAEAEALEYLRSFPPGKVLLYDKECWGCGWNSPLKPAVFDNNRKYVGKLSGKKIIYNKSVFEAKDQAVAKVEFDKTEARYVYVTNYEGQIEKVPFSPGDLGIEKIYENANAQIWRRI